MREEEKEVDHRKKNTKGKARRGLKEKSDAEKNAEALDNDFNRKLKGDAKRREAASKSKPSKTSKKRESSGDETDDVTSKATKKQRSTKSYSKVGTLKPSASSDAAAPTKSRPEPAIKTKDKKDSQRRKSTGSVRFDSSVNKPKLDLFAKSTTKSAPKRKKSKSSSKPSSSQSSGISTSESAGRRRKKSSTSGKSKKSALSMGGFDDTGGFL